MLNINWFPVEISKLILLIYNNLSGNQAMLNTAVVDMFSVNSLNSFTETHFLTLLSLTHLLSLKHILIYNASKFTMCLYHVGLCFKVNKLSKKNKFFH